MDPLLSLPIYRTVYWGDRRRYDAWRSRYPSIRQAWLAEDATGELLMWLAEEELGASPLQLVQAATEVWTACHMGDFDEELAPAMDSWAAAGARVPWLASVDDYPDAPHAIGHRLHAMAYMVEAQAHIGHATAHDAKHAAQSVACVELAWTVADFAAGSRAAAQEAIEQRTAAIVRESLGGLLP